MDDHDIGETSAILRLGDSSGESAGEPRDRGVYFRTGYRVVDCGSGTEHDGVAEQRHGSVIDGRG